MRRLIDWLPYIAGLLVCMLTIQLGLWQTRRAEEKVHLGERLAARERMPPAIVSDMNDVAEWRTVQVSGRWIAEKSILLDNRVHEGRPGYHVFTPLDTGAGTVILVKRGWLPAGMDRTHQPEVKTPGGAVTVTGRVRVPESKPFTLSAQAGEGRLWQYLDMAAYRTWSGLPVSAAIVEQTSASDDSLVRDWPRPELGIDRHRGYAVQWFGLAALAAGLVGWFGWKRWRGNVGSQDDE